MKLEGLVAIVTGGASGIGEATVHELLSKKCKVVIADIDKDLGAKLVSQINNDSVIFVETDVSDEDSVKNLIEKAVAKFGSIHIIVNSAGVLSGGFIYTNKATVKEWWKVFKINALGTYLVCKYAAIHIMKQERLNELKERGVIVNIASMAGFEAPRGQTIYGSSKGAVLGLTLPLARDLGKYGIRVVALAPGIIITPMVKDVKDMFDEKRHVADNPLGRLGNPKEIAQAISSLCSNSYITGTNIRIDGGHRVGHL